MYYHQSNKKEMYKIRYFIVKDIISKSIENSLIKKYSPRLNIKNNRKISEKKQIEGSIDAEYIRKFFYENKVDPDLFCKKSHVLNTS
jgi:hypothetical protein